MATKQKRLSKRQFDDAFASGSVADRETAILAMRDEIVRVTLLGSSGGDKEVVRLMKWAIQASAETRVTHFRAFDAAVLINHTKPLLAREFTAEVLATTKYSMRLLGSMLYTYMVQAEKSHSNGRNAGLSWAQCGWRWNFNAFFKDEKTPRTDAAAEAYFGKMVNWVPASRSTSQL